MGKCNSLSDMFSQVFQQFAEKPMLTSMGKTYTYREIGNLSENFGSYLINSLHMQKGERIALVMPNIIQFPIALIGALRAGMVVVNVNPQYTAREMHYQILDAGATTIVIIENFADKLSEIIDYTLVKNVIITKIGDMLDNPKKFVVNAICRFFMHGKPEYKLQKAVTFNHALRHGEKKHLYGVDIEPEDLAFLQYTGGTTGRPKGAMLSNANLLANIEQCCKEYGFILVKGEEKIIAALPLYHVFSLTVNLLLGSKIGGEIDLIADPRRFNNFVEEFLRFQPTLIAGVNTLFNAMTFNDKFLSHFIKGNLKIVMGGGMSVQKSVAERWEKITGTFIREGYGLTECSPVVAVSKPSLQGYTGCIGEPVYGTEVKIVGENGKVITEKNEPGELYVKGPQVTKGYWKREKDNLNSFDGDWFKTGDIAAWQDNNQLKLVDRKKDMILISGFNVYPNEIEEVVAMHDKVKEVAAIGVKSSTGEAVKIFVVKKEHSLTKEELIAHCYNYLTNYKVPKLVEFVNDLPKSNIGKILRIKLKELEKKHE